MSPAFSLEAKNAGWKRVGDINFSTKMMAFSILFFFISWYVIELLYLDHIPEKSALLDMVREAMRIASFPFLIFQAISDDDQQF